MTQVEAGGHLFVAILDVIQVIHLGHSTARSVAAKRNDCTSACVTCNVLKEQEKEIQTVACLSWRNKRLTCDVTGTRTFR